MCITLSLYVSEIVSYYKSDAKSLKLGYDQQKKLSLNAVGANFYRHIYVHKCKVIAVRNCDVKISYMY